MMLNDISNIVYNMTTASVLLKAKFVVRRSKIVRKTI